MSTRVLRAVSALVTDFRSSLASVADAGHLASGRPARGCLDRAAVRVGGGDGGRLRTAADGLGHQHTEQVEVGSFLVGEGAKLVPHPVRRDENVEPVWRGEQAHGPFDLGFQRVRGPWDGCEVGEFAENLPGRYPPPPRCPAANVAWRRDI